MIDGDRHSGFDTQPQQRLRFHSSSADDFFWRDLICEYLLQLLDAGCINAISLVFCRLDKRQTLVCFAGEIDIKVKTLGFRYVVQSLRISLKRLRIEHIERRSLFLRQFR